MRDYVKQSWHRVLHETASRNGRISLRKSYDGDEANAPPRFTSRLLTISKDDTMVVERPNKSGAAKLCQPGARVDLILPDGQQCWAGRCTVVTALAYQLNEGKAVHAVQLTPPAQVWSAQRRKFFRVGADGADLMSVYVIPTGAAADSAPLPIGDKDKAAGRDGFEAALHDISGGGMGLRIEARSDLGYWLRPGMTMRVVFRMPGDAEPLDVPMTLMRTERVEGHRLHLGMKFTLDDPIEQAKLEDRLTRFSTQLERAQLQRQRGA